MNFVVLLLLYCIIKYVNATAASCTPSNWKATNVTASVAPQNPQIGQTYTLTVDYHIDEPLTGGDAHYLGTMDGFLLINNKYDLCSEILKDSDTPCPLCPDGPCNVHSESTSEIPDWFPEGNLDLKITWTDQNGADVLCIDFNDVVLE
jgi:hypothetical protein